MKIHINGEARSFAPPLSIAGLIDELDLKGKRIAIELNGEVVVRAHYPDTQLADGDRVEIIVAVGGG